MTIFAIKGAMRGRSAQGEKEATPSHIAISPQRGKGKKKCAFKPGYRARLKRGQTLRLLKRGQKGGKNRTRKGLSKKRFRGVPRPGRRLVSEMVSSPGGECGKRGKKFNARRGTTAPTHSLEKGKSITRTFG